MNNDISESEVIPLLQKQQGGNTLGIYLNPVPIIKPIIKSWGRALYPQEYIMLRNAASQKHQVNLDVLLTTGLRYVEAVWVQKHPECYDKYRKFIHLPAGVEKKKKQVFKERDIKLSDYSCMQMEHFFDKKSKLPTRDSWTDNLKMWATKAGVSTEKLSAKTTRKTCVSWLVHLYPNNQLRIFLQLGHTMSMSVEHYLALSFVEQDKIQMKIFFGENLFR